MNKQRRDRMRHQDVSGKKRPFWLWSGLFVVMTLHGCAAFHPVHGVPASYVPDEFLGPSRSGKKTIDLSLLVQRQPDQYRLAAGDILSVYVPGVLGSLSVSNKQVVGETPPINFPQNPADRPTIGYPVTIRDDGAVSLPLVPPINVHGMTLAEAEEAIRKAYTVDAELLNDERDRVLIDLARRREYSVLVVRQETSNELSAGSQPGTVNIGKSKRGTAKIVRLPAYENDVLHALAMADGGADGLPGLDAKNTIYIIRRRDSGDAACLVPGAEDVTWPVSEPMPAMVSPAPSIGPPSMSAPSGPTLSEPLLSPIMDPPTPTTIPQYTPLRPRMEQLRIEEPRIEGLQMSPPSVEPSPSLNPPPAVERPSMPSKAVQPEPRSVMPQQQTSPPSLWPQPAVPAESLRRTSATRPAIWGHTSKPLVRGQSPAGWSMGHSGLGSVTANPYSSARTPYSTVRNTVPYAAPSPYTAPSAWRDQGFGAATFAEQMPPAQIPPNWGKSALGGHDDEWQNRMVDLDSTVDNPNVIKIPIRLSKGERPTFSERDIILEDGDIVFIESRETEVFYTGGLLGGGQYTLPRDYDLHVLEAISVAQSSQNIQNTATRSIGGVSALNMDVTFSASHVAILRRLPNGTRMPIEVDLYKALRRPETENIIIQPGDLIILQYTKLEAIAALFERHLIEGALFGIAAGQLQNNGGN